MDYDETFSPVVKPATVRTVLSFALSRSWPVHQLDVKNAFLHGTLSVTVYCSQPARFVDSSRPDMVCQLNKSLYGLKQAPRAWYSRFATFMMTLGFTEAKSDTTLFATEGEPRVSPVPSSVLDALVDPHCRRAMEEEYAALLANQTWDLVHFFTAPCQRLFTALSLRDLWTRVVRIWSPRSC